MLSVFLDMLHLNTSGKFRGTPRCKNALGSSGEVWRLRVINALEVHSFIVNKLIIKVTMLLLQMCVYKCIGEICPCSPWII